MKTSFNINTGTLGLVALLLVSGCASVGKTVTEQRSEIRTMADETLARLYRSQPSARTAVEKAAGYAVFSNFGLKILVAGGGKGSGLVVDNASDEETFMNMLEVQAGLGAGIKRFRLVFVFQSRSALNEFVNSGWHIGGQVTAAAQLQDRGAALEGAISVAPDIWLYQLTDDGLALELTLKGTKFYKDESLN